MDLAYYICHANGSDYSVQIQNLKMAKILLNLWVKSSNVFVSYVANTDTHVSEGKNKRTSDESKQAVYSNNSSSSSSQVTAWIQTHTLLIWHILMVCRIYVYEHVPQR